MTVGDTRVRYAKSVGSLKLTLNFTNQRRGRAEYAAAAEKYAQRRAGDVLDALIDARKDGTRSLDGENHDN